MPQASCLDVRALINSRHLGSFQKLLIGLGFIIIVLDGFDAVIMGFIAPQLKTDWNISHQALGAVLSAGLIGQALGAMLSGPLADRYGRKLIIVASVILFGVWTLATAFATDVTQMVAFRFLTGLGLGAAIPNTSTLISEYAPDRTRSFLVTVTLSGFTVGAASGGFISAWMIPAFGWHSLLILGGLAPILVGVVLIWKMPESVSFLITRDAPAQRVAAIIERLAPGAAEPGQRYTLGREPVQDRTAIRIVLSPQYRFATAMLWIGYFSVLFLVYLLSSWLPTLIKEGGGYSVSKAAIATAMFQIGGPVGALSIGWAMDRWHKCRVLTGVFLIGAVAVIAIGQITQHFVLLCLFAGLVGFCMNGGSVGMNALAAAVYPTEARATGSSWMIGIGRIGAIISAFIGGELLAQGWSLSQVFIVLVVPALLVAAAMFVQGRHMDRTKSHAITNARLGDAPSLAGSAE